MCSLNDYRCNDDKTSESAKNLLINTTICRKCKCEDVDILLTSQSGYCRMCFLTIANHKFRAALGKSKIIHHGDSILIDYSGELNSIVLLHLIKMGMSESVCKKFIFKTTVLYIDDSAIIGKTDEDKDALRYKILKQIRDFGFDGYVTSIGQVLNKEDTLDIRSIDCQWINDESDKQLCKILANLSDDTSRIELLERLRRQLLISTARKLNCNKIFLTDSTMEIATKVLGDVCLGRGAQLSTLTTFCDSRYADIKLLKPMRDFTWQELIYYSKCHKLNPVKLKITDVKLQAVTSIQTLARNFIAGLESQFSSTVFTIFRTAEKLSARNNEYQDLEDNCVLCNAKLDSMFTSNELSAMRAINISRLVSSKCMDARTSFSEEEGNRKFNYLSLQLSDRECCNDNNDECACQNNKKGQITSEDIQRSLCYSCKVIFQDSDIFYTMPALLSAVQQRSALKNMKEEIDNFLL